MSALASTRSWLQAPTTVPYPWTPFIGLVRTLLATGTLLTLVATPTGNLFRPVLGIGEYPTCRGIQNIGLFCLAPPGYLPYAQAAAVIVLVVVIVGAYPAITAPLHWWVAFSVQTGISIPDGGDQITAVLALLLVPILIFDRRRNHWSRAPDSEGRATRGWHLAVAAATLVAIKVQMSLLYLDAVVSKLPHEEWQNGTFMWYATTGIFGTGEPVSYLVNPIVSTVLGVALLTWVPLAIEGSLALTCLVRTRWRTLLLAGGLALHGSIAVVMGLWSFMFGMFAGLLLLTVPLKAVPYVADFQFTSARDALDIRRLMREA